MSNHAYAQHIKDGKQQEASPAAKKPSVTKEVDLSKKASSKGFKQQLEDFMVSYDNKAWDPDLMIISALVIFKEQRLFPKNKKREVHDSYVQYKVEFQDFTLFLGQSHRPGECDYLYMVSEISDNTKYNYYKEILGTEDFDKNVSSANNYSYFLEDEKKRIYYQLNPVCHQ